MTISISSPEQPKFRVAICGAGIGGLLLAITIGKYDPSIPIDLYEAHDSVETAGVGISLWKRTNEVLAELGLLDEIQTIYTQPPDSSHGMYMRRSDIRQGGYDWYHLVHRYGPSFMQRQQMVAILEKNLPPSCTVHWKKRLVAYTDPKQLESPMMLVFADGSSATADVLVGADGIRSAVRKTMFEAASDVENGDAKTNLKQHVDATWTGLSVYRTLIPAEVLQKVDPENLSLREAAVRLGRHKFIITYPIAKGTLINFVAMVGDPNLVGTHYEGHWVSDATREELIEHFDDFEPQARVLVQQCEKLSKWALHTLKELPFCVRGRVSLVGDACHAMTPHFGAGAGQAIDDAFILGRLLAHPLTTLSRVPDVLCIYEKIRLPIASSVARLSLSSGMLNLFMEPGYYDGIRKEEDVDERGIGASEREGMEQTKQEHLKRWECITQLGGTLDAWKDAEMELQALS